MCDFKQLYCGTDGYVVRCNECGYYQLGFSSLMLSLSETDFRHLCLATKSAACRCEYEEDEFIKQIVIPTPYFGVNILLSMQELESFTRMLDVAESEVISLAMINLFEQDEKY